MNRLDLMLTMLLLAYAAVLAWYVRSVIVTKNKPASSSRHSSHNVKRKRKRLSGKKCPGCNQIIDSRRTVCHHCGHQFEVEPGSEPHPDEVEAGIRKAGPEPNKEQ
ncbi:MAG TPA: hypothetical protein VM658_14820 [bacterium]|nr:hypothetical protein [bacterium]